MAPCCNESSPTTSCQGVYLCCVRPTLCRGEVSCVQQYFGLPPSSRQNMVCVTCMPAFAEKREAVSALLLVRCICVYGPYEWVYAYHVAPASHVDVCVRLDACVRHILF